MRRLLFALAVVAFCVVSSLPAMAAASFSGIAVGPSGAPLSGYSVYVYTSPDDDLADIFSDDGSTPLSNPFLTGANGSYTFYADSGKYKVVVRNAAHPEWGTYIEKNLSSSGSGTMTESTTSGGASVTSYVPSNGAYALGVLHVNGNCHDGETVSIGSEIYELDTDSTISPSNIQVDLAGYEDFTAVLTIPIVIGGDAWTVTIGPDIYEFENPFVGDGVDPAHIEFTVVNTGSTIEYLDNLANAINSSTTIGASAERTSNTTMAIYTTEEQPLATSLSSSLLFFDNATTLPAVNNIDCASLIANAIDSFSADFTALNNNSDVVNLRSQNIGSAYNEVPLSETLATGLWESASTGNGADATSGNEGELQFNVNNGYLYVYNGSSWWYVQLTEVPVGE